MMAAASSLARRGGFAALGVAIVLAARALGGLGGPGQPAPWPQPGPAARPGPAPAPSPLVDPAEIYSGGVPRDAIPAIDRPRFVPASRARSLSPEEPVLAVTVNGEARAYPLRVLLWHEVVNDVVGGVPVVVTYCPLCNTGIAWERPEVGGEVLDFGTSGRLYRSNLVMYDRQTGSLWPQLMGQAVVGPLAGTRLDLVPAQILAWADWRSANREGLVLSSRTGFARPYGTSPYWGYDRSAYPFLYNGPDDRRLHALARVLGVRVAGDAVAFPYRTLRRAAREGSIAVNVRVGGRPVVVLWKAGTRSVLDTADVGEGRDVGAAAAFLRVAGGRTLTFRSRGAGFVDRETGSRWGLTGRATAGPLAGRQLRPAPAFDSLWFAWAAFHPATRIFRPARP